MSTALYIAAKAPRVGLAKTRLGRDIGHDVAVALYRAFLQDLASRFALTPYPFGWYVTPPDAWLDIALLTGSTGRRARILDQRGGDWTERQRAFFAGAPARGEERVILIASDSPQVTVETVTEAFNQLERHDLVFGPVYDGGYYLIGMRGVHDVLDGITMSTGTVLSDIANRARRIGLSVGWVEPTFDVDQADDLDHLRAVAAIRPDLVATRAVMLSQGLLEHPARLLIGTLEEERV